MPASIASEPVPEPVPDQAGEVWVMRTSMETTRMRSSRAFWVLGSDFIARSRAQNITPHVAQNQSGNRRSAIDARTTRHIGYRLSQTIRMRIEQVFGWIKSIGGLRRTRYRGRRRTQLAAYMVGAAYDLLRISKLYRATG